MVLMENNKFKISIRSMLIVKIRNSKNQIMYLIELQIFRKVNPIGLHKMISINTMANKILKVKINFIEQ